MIDKTQQIKDFLKDNFSPSNLEDATHKLKSVDLLELLFDIFPKGCIDDYDLYEIMIILGYKPIKEKMMTDESINIYWCLNELA